MKRSPNVDVGVFTNLHYFITCIVTSQMYFFSGRHLIRIKEVIVNITIKECGEA